MLTFSQFLLALDLGLVQVDLDEVTLQPLSVLRAQNLLFVSVRLFTQRLVRRFLITALNSSPRALKIHFEFLNLTIIIKT